MALFTLKNYVFFTSPFSAELLKDFFSTFYKVLNFINYKIPSLLFHKLIFLNKFYTFFLAFFMKPQPNVPHIL